MEDHDDGFLPGLIELPQEFEHLQLMVEIQVGGGLIQKDGIGILGQGHGNPDPLSLPTGQIIYRQPGIGSGLCDLQGPVDFFPVQVRQVAQAILMGKTTVGHQFVDGDSLRSLQDLGQEGQFSSNFLGWQLSNGQPIQIDRSSLDRKYSGQGLEQGRFATTVGTDDSGDVSFGNGSRQGVNDDSVVVCYSDGISLNV